VTDAHPRCAVCGGAIYQEDHDSPWRHVNLEDWAASPHDAELAEAH
jgi:hypothetical protein